MAHFDLKQKKKGSQLKAGIEILLNRMQVSSVILTVVQQLYVPWLCELRLVYDSDNQPLTTTTTTTATTNVHL